MLTKAVSRSLLSDNAGFLSELDLEVVSYISTTTFPRSQSQLLTRLGALDLECALGDSERWQEGLS